MLRRTRFTSRSSPSRVSDDAIMDRASREEGRVVVRRSSRRRQSLVVWAAALLCQAPWRCHAFGGCNPRVAFRSLPPPMQAELRGRSPPRPIVRLRSRYSEKSTGSRYWEGDDRRLWTRWMRQIQSGRTRQFETRPGQTAILDALVAFYLYQVVTTLAWMRSTFPAEWGAHWFRILVDVAMGTALPGPILQKGGMKAMALSLGTAHGELHPFLLSGLLHGSILHWLLDVHALSSRRRIPAWLETGLGSSLFATAFVASVVAGNVALVRLGPASDRLASAVSLPPYLCGASAGICGLHGLHLVSLIRMRSRGGGDGLGRALKSLLWTMLYGYLIPEVALVGSVGGLVGGALVGFLFGPRYSSSYAMKRKWSTEVDVYSRDYRRAMGFGIQPRRPLLKLAYFWAAVALLVACVPPLRSVPRAIWEVMTLARA